MSKVNDAPVPIFGDAVDKEIVTSGTNQCVALRRKALRWEQPAPPRRDEFDLGLWLNGNG